MKKVGITGGIGSGKTTICHIFEMLDIPIYYADSQAKKIMATNAAVKQQIKALLGHEAYHSNGKLNRNFIASKIFSDKSLLESINQIVHPAVHADADRWTQQVRSEINPDYVIREAALLVENGSYKVLDALIVVTCPESIRIKRVMKRDRLSFEEVQKKIKNQMAESEKVKVADYVIVNDGVTPIIPQVWEIHKKISKI